MSFRRGAVEAERLTPGFVSSAPEGAWLAAIGDYDGNGADDILWQTGDALLTWLATDDDPYTFTSVDAYGPLATDWRAAGGSLAPDGLFPAVPTVDATVPDPDTTGEGDGDDGWTVIELTGSDDGNRLVLPPDLVFESSGWIFA